MKLHEVVEAMANDNEAQATTARAQAKAVESDGGFPDDGGRAYELLHDAELHAEVASAMRTALRVAEDV